MVMGEEDWSITSLKPVNQVGIMKAALLSQKISKLEK